jgi:putative ABC transport system substrate-binding protein
VIDRRTFIGSLVLVPLLAEAQQPGKTYTVGILSISAFEARPSGISGGLIEALQELGYIEGRNLVIRRATAEFKADRLPGLAADLVAAGVDVIVTTSTGETRAAKNATSTIPIVMTLAPDPIEQGLVVSLSRPGGNVTGLISVVPGVSQKYIELLREAVPSASRFVVVGAPNSPFPAIRRELQVAAQQAGINISFVEIVDPNDYDSALARAKRDGAGGIIVALNALTYTHRAMLAQLALKHRFPGIYWDRGYVENGGLMSYGASLHDVGRRAAYFVDRIFDGAKPADLPVEQPTKFDLVINLKTAKALGISLPQSLLLRANHLIE